MSEVEGEASQFSPDNWAHSALLQMDEAETLVRWGSVSAEPNRYYAGAAAFWEVCHLLRDERQRLHEGRPEYAETLLRVFREAVAALDREPEQNVELRKEMHGLLARIG